MKANKVERIPVSVVRRLPLYLRHLEDLAQQGELWVSSQALGQELEANPAQIRKDLAYFGDFGRKGVGYDIAALRHSIREILNLNEPQKVALVGVGRLGAALCLYSQQHSSKLRISFAFDADTAKIDSILGEVRIQSQNDMTEVLRKNLVRMALISVPAIYAQNVADELVSAGVTAILNFAPVILKVPSHVHLRNADFMSELQSLAYYVND